MRCHGMIGLAAAEALYHVRCYDNFRKLHPSGQGLVIDDIAMKELLGELYVHRMQCTWTSIELHEMYVSYGGELSRKQMFFKLAEHLGDDAVVLSINGCASIIGFREFVTKTVKMAKLDTAPDAVIVDVSQLFYHIVWPHGGIPSDLIASIKGCLSRYPNNADKIIVFDKYQGISAKDHERKRQAGEESINYDLFITCSLPKREIIMKCKNDKQKLASVLSTFSIGENVVMETKDDGAFSYDEADITMISYVLQAAYAGKNVIRVLSYDTDYLSF